MGGGVLPARFRLALTQRSRSARSVSPRTEPKGPRRVEIQARGAHARDKMRERPPFRRSDVVKPPYVEDAPDAPNI